MEIGCGSYVNIKTYVLFYNGVQWKHYLLWLNFSKFAVCAVKFTMFTSRFGFGVGKVVALEFEFSSSEVKCYSFLLVLIDNTLSNHAILMQSPRINIYLYTNLFHILLVGYLDIFQERYT